MMTPTIKLNLLHKQIVTIFQGEAVWKVGELTEGWKHSDHIQHTVDVLSSKISILRRQFENTDLEKEDKAQLKSFQKMLERDLKNMIFNIQNDKLPDELVQLAKAYLNDMKDMIYLLRIAMI